MLQIGTGKLFSQKAERVNQLRGALFTNLVIDEDLVVETVAGSLRANSSGSGRPFVLIYELAEQMEDGRELEGMIISSTVQPFLDAFAQVVSFALNGLCSPDVALIQRLTSGTRGLATQVKPSTIVRRFFNPEVRCQNDELTFLNAFTKQLIGLRRRTFLSVMQAIRTWVNAMHRVADDLDVAYTLMVASVESLAQEFDGYQGSWNDISGVKRRAVDAALVDADEATAQRVRAALIGAEHTALSHRFRAFSEAHVTADYFRRPIDGEPDPVRLVRSELPEVLRRAYESRSGYMHQLKRLPKILTLGHREHPGETAQVRRATHLSLQGLSRLMREVIINFVMDQETVDHEPWDYHLERHGVIQMSLAPQYWVGNVGGDMTQAGRDKLEGFLHLLAPCLLHEPQAKLVDLRAVLKAAAGFVTQSRRSIRLPYLALFVLYRYFVMPAQVDPVPPAIDALAQRELAQPSSEALVVLALMDGRIPWPLDVHKAALDTYFQQRHTAHGLRVPRVFEAMMLLALAERYRQAGDVRWRTTVARAVENMPGHVGLLALESDNQEDHPINGRAILLPPQTPNDASHSLG